MEINVLAVSIGNSRIALGAFAAGELVHVERVSVAEPQSWAAAIETTWAKISDRDDPAVAAASVNDRVMDELEQLLFKKTNQVPQWVGKQLDSPIAIRTDAPRKTGIDRVLAVAAAYEQLEKACVVVDAGTALTINCCSDKGEFMGGAILPGVAMQLRALHEGTGLPLVKAAVPTGSVGTSTENAILHGVFAGIRGAVQNVVENYATELGNWPEVIATGGDAKLLFSGWEIVHAISPDLVLYGIALAYTSRQVD